MGSCPYVSSDGDCVLDVMPCFMFNKHEECITFNIYRSQVRSSQPVKEDLENGEIAVVPEGSFRDRGKNIWERSLEERLKINQVIQGNCSSPLRFIDDHLEPLPYHSHYLPDHVAILVPRTVLNSREQEDAICGLLTQLTLSKRHQLSAEPVVNNREHKGNDEEGDK